MRVGGPRLKRVAATMAVAALVSVASVACSSGSAHTAPPTSTSVVSSTPAPTTTTTLDPTKAAILAAYRASWAAFVSVAETVPVVPTDPRLPQYDTGKELKGVRAALTRLRLLGHYNHGSTELNPVVTSVSGNAATVTDCLFDQSYEVDTRTNAAVEKPNVGHTLDTFTLARVDGHWYVSDSTIVRSGKAEDTCVPATL